MNARRLVSHLVLGLVPIVTACGDDTTGTGGGGGDGGGATVTTGSTSSPTSVTTSTTTGTGTGGDGTGGGTGGTGGGTGGTGGGTGGTGGSGGGEFIAGEDTCPGTVLEPEVGQPLVFNGTTEGAEDDYDTCSEPDEDYDGADVVYQFELAEDASVSIALAGAGGFVGNLILRSGCELELGETCVFLGDPRRFAGHLAAGTWSVMVDSLGAAGDYELGIVVADPACGDGILNPNEACDPGPANPNDFCNDPETPEECQVPPPEDNQEACPGEAVDVPAGPSVLLASDGYSTNGFIDDYTSSCMLTGGGVDRVFALDPAITGTLTVTIGNDADNAEAICTIDQSDPGCWDQMLHARTTCDVLGTEVACADETFDVEEIAFPVTAGTPIFLFVDGYDGGTYSRGPFNLHFDLQ